MIYSYSLHDCDVVFIFKLLAILCKAKVEHSLGIAQLIKRTVLNSTSKETGENCRCAG